jgi:hypothetical protein
MTLPPETLKSQRALVLASLRLCPVATYTPKGTS